MGRHRKALDDYPRIRLIRFNCWERPLRALIVTKAGLVRIKWQDLGGSWCWSCVGPAEAIWETLPAIEHIEQMCESLH